MSYFIVVISSGACQPDSELKGCEPNGTPSGGRPGF